MHGGTQLTLAAVHKKCWIFGGRVPIKSHIQRCVVCVSTSRVLPYAFESTGVDYARPVQLKYFQGRGTRCYNGWIAVFVCFITSAIHLEAVSDYTAEGFLKAFRRVTIRRGICKTLYSDCGTNFKGAVVILKQLITGTLNESSYLQQILTSDETQWIFNPPGAPHMDGKWEAAVKSVKHHLQLTIADLLLTYEYFSTFLTQVEALLNSRPLSGLTDDPRDISALTPGHFIQGAPLNTVSEPNLTNVPISRLSHYQRIQERLQYFRQRWSAECPQSH
ncbi:uncharacterized protein LOC103571516 [Microplitis demolitor]|uniref:uncharacterized protein LOC103571516 n=1 Tax=Microplitis demolitor TaxID=69319 RepID=UPI0004CC97E5|nr:uncharacterized protein LOC103571516 [Microplitis demolitor]